MIKSRALEVNLARTQVEVAIDSRYTCLQEVLARYYGLMEGLNTFLKEISHPYKNWQFIVDGARSYALDYFHMMKRHPRGPEAVQRLIELFCEALDSDSPQTLKIDAADNLILFLQKIVKTAEEDFPAFAPLIDQTFVKMAAQRQEIFALFERSFYSLKRLAWDLADCHRHVISDYGAMNRLLIRALGTTYSYWLEAKDPLAWFLSEAELKPVPDFVEKIFHPVTHEILAKALQKVTTLAGKTGQGGKDTLGELLQLPHHSDIVQVYRRLPQQLLEAGEASGSGNSWKIIFLFHIMNLDALSIIHEDCLRDINRTLHWLISHQKPRYLDSLIDKTFSILQASARHYPATALSCIGNLGQGIYKTGNGPLIDHFVNAVVSLEFQTPRIGGVGNDWQIRVNTAHIHNIRTWLQLIQLGPKRSTRLLSNLIIHLAVSGVYIRDTDLFGRDITNFLDSDIGPVYNLVKQLARLFPVYFNDIGAEGELRDISTQIDEICHRRDPLIHFLRKQSHVESSSRVLNLMETALHFWTTRDKSPLAAYLPPNIYDKIAVEGSMIDGVHAVVQHLAGKGIQLPQELLCHSRQTLEALIAAAEQVQPADRERVVLFAEFYKQLNNKYNLSFLDLEHSLRRLAAENFPNLDRLQAALKTSELKKKTFDLLDYLELLKGIILSPETFEIREDIYKKRHFTVDIPSMYGSYNEMKFNAMGLTLRLEALVNVLLEELVATIDLSLITKATCYQIYDRLMLFNKALQIDGIASAEMEHQLEMLAHSLEVRGFSFTQYLDIYKGFAQTVKNIINDYFNNIHGDHITRILASLPADLILEKYRPAGGEGDDEKLRHRTLEIFFRDRLATSLGLQQLDLFLSRILNTLYHQSNKLPKDQLRRLLNYDPQKAIVSLQKPDSKATGIIYLGNKGLNMLKLKNLGMPIPPAFIVTTEIFRCREIIESFAPAEDNFREQVAQHISELERITGKHFGNPGNPLLISVRSGSSISQPGMMDTFLNVGMNDVMAQGLASRSGNDWFAWDSYRRFLQCYGMANGLTRDDFDAIISRFKHQLGIPLKKSFSGAQMREVALAYKQRILDDGLKIPEDPMTQLHQIIKIVIDSWESAKAKTYRQIMGISDDWGTAVTVQAMVFGNLSQQSGSGVIFTHNPRWAGESLSLWGDFTLENQGEDVVSGLVRTLPISVKQQEVEMRETDITLETHFPDLYRVLLDYANTLVFQKGWSPQEMEFTFESADKQDLYLLQTRDMAIRERKRVLTFHPEQKAQANYLGHGIGVSGGAMSGRLVFSLEEVDRWRTHEPDTPLILARGDTVPDDIKEIFATDGLLTARGGVTSHASVVAHRLGKTCVVGCGTMVCDESGRTVQFQQHTLTSGDHISIDGREGSVYQGLLKIKET